MSGVRCPVYGVVYYGLLARAPRGTRPSHDEPTSYDPSNTIRHVHHTHAPVSPTHIQRTIQQGHNCWGILWAPVSGKSMSELVLDGEAACVDLAPFSPMRFLPKAERGGRGRKRGAVAVGEQW